MTHSEACTELAKLIENGHYDYSESAGLAIYILHTSFEKGDEPKMSLALAKTLNTGFDVDAEDECDEDDCPYFGKKKASTCRCRIST